MSLRISQNHWVQPKVHLFAFHICLCGAFGTEICAMSSVVVLSWSLNLVKLGLLFNFSFDVTPPGQGLALIDVLFLLSSGLGTQMEILVGTRGQWKECWL